MALEQSDTNNWCLFPHCTSLCVFFPAHTQASLHAYWLTRVQVVLALHHTQPAPPKGCRPINAATTQNELYSGYWARLFPCSIEGAGGRDVTASFYSRNDASGRKADLHQTAFVFTNVFLRPATPSILGRNAEDELGDSRYCFWREQRRKGGFLVPFETGGGVRPKFVSRHIRLLIVPSFPRLCCPPTAKRDCGARNSSSFNVCN